MLQVNFLQGGNGTNRPGTFGGAENQIKRFNQRLDHQLHVVACFDIRFKNLIGQQRFDILLLIRKSVRFNLIIHVFKDHAPNRSLTGTGNRRYDLDGMLAIKYIVDAIASADLDGVNLMDVKIIHRPLDVLHGKVSLVVLVR